MYATFVLNNNDYFNANFFPPTMTALKQKISPSTMTAVKQNFPIKNIHYSSARVDFNVCLGTVNKQSKQKKDETIIREVNAKWVGTGYVVILSLIPWRTRIALW